MNENGMRKAGENLAKLDLTDDELSRCLEATRLALVFLDGGAEKWHVSAIPQHVVPLVLPLRDLAKELT